VPSSSISSSRAGTARLVSSPLVALLTIVAMTILADRVLARALHHVMGLSQFRFARLYAGGMQNDIVVLGNSRAIHSIHAPELGTLTCRASLHLGYNGIPSFVARALAADYLALNRRPTYALIEASMLFETGVTSHIFAPLMADSPRLAALVRRDMPGRLPYADLFHLYRYNSELFRRSLFYMGQDDQDWINRDSRITPDKVESFYRRRTPDLVIQPSWLEALVALVRDLEASGVVPVLYVAPYHRSVAERFPEKMRWIEAMKEAVRADAEVIDLSRLLPGEDGFADPLHLNLEGSRRVMAALVEAVPGLRRCSPGA
jgi:hypothetical protein